MGAVTGAVGPSGILEKNVNLHVAMAAALRIYASIHDEDNDTTVELEEQQV